MSSLFDKLKSLHPTRPIGNHDKLAEDSSLKHLQELYTVTVGLSLTIGVERLFPGELHGTLEAGAVATFIAFLATLLPFYHGALRHLDQKYIYLVNGRKPSPRWLLFVDFLTLFLEACLLISMGATVEQPHTFLVLLLLLLLLDIIWSQIPRFAGSEGDKPESGSEGDKDEWGWIVVNVPALAVGVLLFFVAERSRLVSPDVLPFLVGLFAMIRTFYDYFWNWKKYFPEPAHSPDPPGAKDDPV